MLRLIGDAHGWTEKYIQIIESCEYSVQLGDMGFSDNYSILENQVDSAHHRFVPGNHDNYNNLPLHAFKSDWGMCSLGGVSFFYIRGAYSVDKMRRLIGVSWWEQEEISRDSGIEMVEAFKLHKPDLVLSHDCPVQCHPYVLTNPLKSNLSKTTQILTAAFEEHNPKQWVFGHHHCDWSGRIGDTEFTCLDELSFLDVD